MRFLAAALLLWPGRAFAVELEAPRELPGSSLPLSARAGQPAVWSLPGESLVLAPVETAKIVAAAQANAAAQADASARAEGRAAVTRTAQAVREAAALPARSFSAAFDGAKGFSLAEDAVVYRGWQLAQNSGSERARFGALVVDREGRIIGEGWNRTSTKAERKLIGVGFIIHAEQVAIAQAARESRKALEGARLYVIGISKDAALFAQKLDPSIACQICARTLEKFRVSVMSSSKEGFRELGWDKLVAAAKANAAGKWWQASYKGKAENPNIRWRPIAEVERRLASAGAPAKASEPVAKDEKAALGVPAGPDRDAIQRLAARPFNDPIYSRPYFRALGKPKSSSFADKLGWKARSPAQLAALAAKFPLPPAMKGKYSVSLQLLEDSKEQAPHLTLLGIVSRRDGTPSGSFSVAFKRGKDGRTISHIHGVYFDRTDPALTGIAPAMLRFLRESVYPPLGVAKETLKADHAGRYVWAKAGFRFDPTYWFKDEGGKGPAIKLAELARRSFARFLKRNGLKPGDLALRGKPLASLDELETPDDFASVVDRRGRALTVRPFVLGEEQAPADLDVGKAFMLGDYRPGKGFVLSMARTKFAVDAMPYWNGYRDVVP